MEGNFYFKNIPLAPPETKVVLHENPNRRRTWGHHRVKVWYIGPTVEHYRCYKVYIYNKTWERIADTVELFPENTTMPVISSANAATHMAT